MKNNLWENYSVKNCSAPTAGLRLHFDSGIDPALRGKFILLAKRLRKNYVFPVPVNIRIVNLEKVTLRSGRKVYGSFRWYPRRSPGIKVAAAYEAEELSRCGKDELDVMILSSLIHELTHYYQFCSDLEQSDSVSERQANHYRYSVIERLMPELF